MLRPTTSSSLSVQYALLGREGVVYPGHPLVLAHIVMQQFPSLENALATPPGAEASNLMTQPGIPGSAAMLAAAVEVLKKVKAGYLAEALDHANEQWRRGVGHDVEPWTRGMAQALELAPAFKEQAVAWCKPLARTSA